MLYESKNNKNTIKAPGKTLGAPLRKQKRRQDGQSRDYNRQKRRNEREDKKKSKQEISRERKMFEHMEKNVDPGYSFAAIGSNLQPGFVKNALEQQKMEENNEIAELLLQQNAPPSPVRNYGFSELDNMNRFIGPYDKSLKKHDGSSSTPLSFTSSTPLPFADELNYINYEGNGGKRRKSVKRKNKSGRKRTVKKNKTKGKKTRKN